MPDSPSRYGTGPPSKAQFPGQAIGPTALRRRQGKKREPPRERLCRVITGRRQTEWTGATRNPDDWTVNLRPVKLKKCLTARPISTGRMPEFQPAVPFRGKRLNA